MLNLRKEFMVKNLMQKISFNIVFLFLLAFSHNAFSQCDPTANFCKKHLGNDFISDGQSYRSMLIEEEVAEFNITFFGGSQYRIAACSGLSDSNLIFSIYDKDRNLLFSNENYANAPFWNFKVNSTINCIIEAKLNSSNLISGCAVLVIGFKN
jgi:hypothetical protein